MDKKIIQSYDRFFKNLFSEKNEIKEFVTKTFPTEITKNLQLETLELDQTEYVDSKLRTTYSDLVYNCKYGNNTDIKISLLFEHKSNPEKFPHFQLLGYMLKVWEIQIKQNQELTLIIPIIFYHGKSKWTNKPFDTYFKGLDDTLQNFIPKFDYQLIDTSKFTNEEIINLFESLQLQIGILVMKNIFNEQKILQETNKIFANLNQLLQTERGEQFFETIVAYLLYATGIDAKKYAENMKTISQKAEKKFVSTAMRLETSGIEKGIRKVAFSMIQENYTNKEIIKLTGLNEKQIEYLRTLKEYQLELETI
ncbi:MAG: Rpn family recombination-promoting nuclease/putative transposase [Bacteroidota bacterium]|nr:Rpn family recombination-promoting nuclease/putative transposase [Bacteroidota bacterium]